MGKFGWSLPPGVTMNMIDPPEPPCEICGQQIDNCICPECSVCGEYGFSQCYVEHGMRRTEEQKFLLECAERQWREEAEVEALYWKEIIEEWT